MSIFAGQCVKIEFWLIAYDLKGNQRGQSQLVSAQGKTSIRVAPEKMQAAPNSVVYVDVMLSGENGEREVNTDETPRVSVEGGELLGFGSAKHRTEERYQSGEFTTYYGMVQAIIRADESGHIQVMVSSDHYGNSSAMIEISK